MTLVSPFPLQIRAEPPLQLTRPIRRDRMGCTDRRLVCGQSAVDRFVAIRPQLQRLDFGIVSNRTLGIFCGQRHRKTAVRRSPATVLNNVGKTYRWTGSSPCFLISATTLISFMLTSLVPVGPHLIEAPAAHALRDERSLATCHRR